MALDWLVRATLLLGVALVAGYMLRRAPARARHGLWTVAFVGLLALPLLSSVLPALPVPIASLAPAAMPSTDDADEFLAAGRASLPGSSGAGVAGTGATATGAAVASAADADAVTPAPGWPVAATAIADRLPAAATVLSGLWLLGVLGALTSLLAAQARASLLIRRAQPLECDRWRVTAARLGRRLGLRRPVPLLISDAVTTPMAGGLFRRAILLPPAARTWNRSRRSMVLAHELVHLRRLDPFRHAIVRLGMAAYWFHPLAWIAARHAALDREQACDEAVVAMGARPSTYARQLLELAETLACPAAPAVATLPIIEHSLLEKRLMAILEPSPRPLSRSLAIGCVALAGALTLSIAAAQPVAPQATSAAPVAATTAPIVASPQGEAERDSACRWDIAGSNFSGSMSISDDDGVTVIREQVGTRDGNRVIQKSFGDTRLCLLAEGDVEFTDAGMLDTVGAGGSVVLEARRDGHVQRMRLGAGGDVAWWVDGEQRPYDASARSWREGVLAVLASTWQVSQLRGEVSSLRGEISSIRGQASSLRGEISSARGHVSSLRGEISSARGEVSSMKGAISSARGEVSSMKGEISSIRGHESPLRGAIASERGAISSLRAARGAASDSTRSALDAEIAQHEARIVEIEAELSDYDGDARVAEVEARLAQYDLESRTAPIQARIDAFDLEARVADLEQQIDDYDLEGRTRDLEAQIAELDVEGKVAAIEAQIQALDADRRIEEIQGRLRTQLDSLERALDSIR